MTVFLFRLQPSIKRQRKLQRDDRRLYTKLEDSKISAAMEILACGWKRGIDDDTRRSERPIISQDLTGHLPPSGPIENLSEDFVSSKIGTEEQ